MKINNDWQTLDKAYWVIDNVYTMSAGDFKNLFLPLRLRIVNKIICAGIFLDCIELGL